MKMIRKLKNHYIAKCNYIKYVKKLPIDDHRIVLESQQEKSSAAISIILRKNCC